MSGVRRQVVWYVRRDEQVLGPYEPIEIAVHAKLANLRTTDFLWCHGLAGWVAAGNVPGLLTPPARGPVAAPRVPRPAAQPTAPPATPVQGRSRAPTPATGPRRPGVETPGATHPRAPETWAPTMPAAPRAPAAASPAVGRAAVPEALPHAMLAALGTALARSDASGPTGALLPGSASLTAPAAEPALPSAAVELEAQSGPALSRARALLDWSGQQIAHATARVGGHMSLAALHQHLPAIRWEEALDGALAKAIPLIRAPNLAVLLDDERITTLAGLLIDHLPMTARYGVLLTVGRPGFERALLHLRDRIAERIGPDELHAPLAATLPSLLGSGAIKAHVRALAERMRADVTAAIARRVAGAAAGAHNRADGAAMAAARVPAEAT